MRNIHKHSHWRDWPNWEETWRGEGDEGAHPRRAEIIAAVPPFLLNILKPRHLYWGTCESQPPVEEVEKGAKCAKLLSSLSGWTETHIQTPATRAGGGGG